MRVGNDVTKVRQQCHLKGHAMLHGLKIIQGPANNIPETIAPGPLQRFFKANARLYVSH